MARAKGPTAIGEWARRARADAGYSSADKAAAAAGVPANWLRQVEAYYWTDPDHERIARLAELYGSEPPAPEPRPASDDRITPQMLLDAYRDGIEEGLRISRGQAPAQDRAAFDAPARAVAERVRTQRPQPAPTPGKGRA